MRIHVPISEVIDDLEDALVHQLTLAESYLETLCRHDGLRDFVSAGRTQPVRPYARRKSRDEFIDRWSRDSCRGALCWYHASLDNLQSKADRMVKPGNRVVRVPYLYWTGKDDYVCRHEFITPPRDAGLLPKSVVIIRDGGHWAFLEHPDIFGADLVDWLHANFE
jgi:soluble epoxide hydrolase / lipid-phosphate phosphatase